MDLNITIKHEPFDEDSSIVPFETTVSDIYKSEVVDCKEIKFHVADIKMEDDPLNVSNNITTGISLNNRIDENAISTQLMKRNINIPSLIGDTENEESFLCPICKIAFVEISTFIGHLNAVHIGNMKSCPVCGKDFSKWAYTGSIIVRHMWKHSLEEYKSCTKMKVIEMQIKRPKIKIEYIGKETAQKPNKDMKVEGDYPCQLCSKSYTVLTDLINHIGVHKEVSQSSCRVCNLQFKSDDKLTEHIKTKVLKSVDEKVISTQLRDCPVCSRSFQDKSAMMLHFEKLHSCPLCSIVLESKIGMDNHIKSYTCQTCLHGKSIHQLKSYMNKCTQHNHFCIVCKTEYNDKYLSDQMMIHECNICHKSFTKPQFLVSHVLNHRSYYQYQIHMVNGKKDLFKVHIEKPYSCSFCQISFKDIQNLLEHTNKIHSYEEILFSCKEKPICCPVCFTSFTDRTVMISHFEESHSLKMNKFQIYACNICDKGCTNPRDLMYHVAQHTEYQKFQLINVNGSKEIVKILIEKPYSCSLCHISFKDIQNFHEHVHDHPFNKEMKKGFYCSLCGKNFKTPNSYKRYQQGVKRLFLSRSQDL